MWQIMHWLVGISRVNSCLSGCPDSLCGMVGSGCWDMPRVPKWALLCGVELVAVVGIDHVAARAARRAIVARIVVGAHQPDERVVQARLGDVQHRNPKRIDGTRTA